MSDDNGGTAMVCCVEDAAREIYRSQPRCDDNSRCPVLVNPLFLESLILDRLVLEARATEAPGWVRLSVKDQFHSGDVLVRAGDVASYRVERDWSGQSDRVVVSLRGVERELEVWRDLSIPDRMSSLPVLRAIARLRAALGVER